MKTTKLDTTKVKVDWPEDQVLTKFEPRKEEHREIDTIVLPRRSMQSAFIKLLTSKKGALPQSVRIKKGKVTRPYLHDEGNRRFIAEILEPITGENFTGKVDLKIELKPNSLGVLLDNAFYARVSTA